jgi:hypothetical protein
MQLNTGSFAVHLWHMPHNARRLPYLASNIILRSIYDSLRHCKRFVPNKRALKVFSEE